MPPNGLQCGTRQVIHSHKCWMALEQSPQILTDLVNDFLAQKQTISEVGWQKVRTSLSAV